MNIIKKSISVMIMALMLSGIAFQPAMAETSETDASEAQTENQTGTQGETEATDTQAETAEAQEETKPEAVKTVNAKATKTRGKIVVKWSKSKDADGYYIYRATKRNGKYSKIKTVKASSKRSYTDKRKKISTNKYYYYRVKAYKNTDDGKLINHKADTDAAKNKYGYRRSFKVKATAYTGGGRCANGKRCKVGRIAVDPRVIPLGTWLYVEGYGLAQACDTGGAIKGKKIDLYMSSNKKCRKYGVRKTRVYILHK